MTGCTSGAERTAAKRIGVDLLTYRTQRAAGLRWCSVCRVWLEAGAFHADRRRPGGGRSQCRACAAVAKSESKARCRARRREW